jgi:hypothetical protein
MQINFSINLDNGENEINQAIKILEKIKRVHEVITVRNQTPVVDIDPTLIPPVTAVTESDEKFFDVDERGETYDPEKHSVSRTKNADGTWRAKKNTVTRVQRIKAENPPIPLPPIPEIQQITGEKLNELITKWVSDKIISFPHVRDILQRHRIKLASELLSAQQETLDEIYLEFKGLISHTVK